MQLVVGGGTRSRGGGGLRDGGWRRYWARGGEVSRRGVRILGLGRGDLHDRVTGFWAVVDVTLVSLEIMGSSEIMDGCRKVLRLMVFEDLNVFLSHRPCDPGVHVEEKQVLTLGFDTVTTFCLSTRSIAGSFG